MEDAGGVGDAVGVTVGVPVGLTVGETVGVPVGLAVGEMVGVAVGVPVGPGPACAAFAKPIASERTNTRRMTGFVAGMTTPCCIWGLLICGLKHAPTGRVIIGMQLYNRALFSESLYG